MRRIRKIRLLLFVFILMFALFGCNNQQNNNDETPVLSILVNDFILNVGETSTIVPIIDGVDEMLEVEYTSNDDSIATVVDGIITGVSGGETTIIVKVKNFPNVYVEANVKVNYTDDQLLDEILNWAKEYVGDELNLPINFPTSHPTYESELIWVSSDQTKLSNRGLIFPQKYDISVDITVTVVYKDLRKTDTFPVIITGYVPEEVGIKFLNQFSSLITRNYEVKTASSNPDATITWYSTNTNVFTNEGVYIKPFNDTPFEIVITVIIEKDGITKQFRKQVVAQGLTIYEKTDIVEEWVVSQLQIDQIVNEDMELPIKYDEYNATLEWSSNKPNIVSSTGKLTLPELNSLIVLRCQVTIGQASASFYLDFEVAGRQYDEKWVAVETLLNTIFVDEINPRKLSIEGVGPAYIAYNYGYIPFFDNTSSTILDGYVDPSLKQTRPGRIKSSTRWIVIHDTANNKDGADAEMHKKFIQDGPQSVSWHYTVDDNKIYQHIPDEEVAWHAGDSEGNNYGIGIETCINIGVDYNTVMRKTAKLTSELMKEFDLTLYNVRQHNYFSGKDCPHVMRSQNRWLEFLDLVSIEYFGITQLEGVQFQWESLTPTLLDNSGRIIKNELITPENITYKVTVTYNGVVKEYTHTSILLPPYWL